MRSLREIVNKMISELSKFKADEIQSMSIETTKRIYTNEKEIEKNIKIWFQDYQENPKQDCSPFISTVKQVRDTYNVYLSEAKALCDKYLKEIKRR